MLLALLGGPVVAALELSLAVDDIVGDDWLLRGMLVTWRGQDPRHGGLRIDWRSVELPQGHGTLDQVSLSCALTRDPEGRWHCAEGRLLARDTPLGPQTATWQGSWRSGADWSLSIDSLRLGRGDFALALNGSEGRWRADLRLKRVALPRLIALGPAAALPADWQVTGQASGRLSVDGEDTAPTRARLDLLVDDVGYGSPDGTQAAEQGRLKLGLDATPMAGGWRFGATIGVPRGGVYTDPLFVDATQTPLAFRARGAWRVAQKRLSLDSWSMTVGELLRLSGSGALSTDDASLIALDLSAHSDEAGALYTTLLQPFLIGTPADDLALTGQIGLAFQLDRQGLERVVIDLDGFTLADRQGRFELAETDGRIAWGRGQTVPLSRLTAAGAGVYRIPTGPFDVQMRLAGDGIELKRPMVVPLLDGEVALERFTLHGLLAGAARPHWQATASLRGVSLERLSASLGWPVFNGSVSGELKDMRYAEQVFRIGGGLELQAFDGDLRVDDLRIRDPLGPVPILNADAAFSGLSLAQLTQTFSFGRIEGRLDGEVRDIRLVAWQPDRFDLHFHTPPNDRSRRRISQRAVENLTELGNGGGAALSSTVLRLFDEFRYSAIDLKVGLDGAVATLDGLARPDGGYYLVRGSGLPRIDVIGRNRRVAWQDLLERLRQIRVEEARIE